MVAWQLVERVSQLPRLHGQSWQRRDDYSPPTGRACMSETAAATTGCCEIRSIVKTSGGDCRAQRQVGQKRASSAAVALASYIIVAAAPECRLRGTRASRTSKRAGSQARGVFNPSAAYEEGGHRLSWRGRRRHQKVTEGSQPENAEGAAAYCTPPSGYIRSVSLS